MAKRMKEHWVKKTIVFTTAKVDGVKLPQREIITVTYKLFGKYKTDGDIMDTVKDESFIPFQVVEKEVEKRAEKIRFDDWKLKAVSCDGSEDEELDDE